MTMSMNIYIICSILTAVEATSLLEARFLPNKPTSQSHTHMNASSNYALDEYRSTCSIAYGGRYSRDEVWWRGELDGYYRVFIVSIDYNSNITIAVTYMNNLTVYVSPNGSTTKSWRCNHFLGFDNSSSDSGNKSSDSGNNSSDSANNSSGSANNSSGSDNNSSGSANNSSGSDNNSSDSVNNSSDSANNSSDSANNSSDSDNNSSGSDNNSSGSDNISSDGRLNITCLKPLSGRYVTIKKEGKQRGKMLVLCEVHVFVDEETVSLAYGRPILESKPSIRIFEPDLLVDGYRNTCTAVITNAKAKGWLSVILDHSSLISGVRISTLPVKAYTLSLKHFDVYVSNDKNILEQQLCSKFELPTEEEESSGSVYLPCQYDSQLIKVKYDMPLNGKFVTFLKKNDGRRANIVPLCEIQIYPAKIRNCTKEEIFCSVTSKCLRYEKMCDGIINCPDESDESFCACPEGQHTCKEGTCIPMDWVCDGTKDCPTGSDEEYGCDCHKKFKCSRRKKCIDMAHRCDGNIDCPDHSDENGCYSLEDNFLMSKFEGEDRYYVCSDYWFKAFSRRVCEDHLWGIMAKSYTGKITSSPSTMLILTSYNPDRSDLPGLTEFEDSPLRACASGEYVKIDCIKKYDTVYTGFCGTRGYPNIDVGRYIINGEVAAESAWPWHVQLIVDRSYKCGGVILDTKWILTTGRCVLGISGELFIKVGTNIKNDPKVESLRVSQIIIHPEFKDPYIQHNLALLKLISNLTYSDLVRPICLPDKIIPDIKMFNFRYCVVSSFGNVDRDRGESMYLLQGRLNIIPTYYCSKELDQLDLGYASHFVKTNKVLCAGTLTSQFGINTCVGDGGSPVVCKLDDDSWILIGLVGGLEPGVRMQCTTNIITRVDDEVQLFLIAMMRSGSSYDTTFWNVAGIASFLMILCGKEIIVA